MQLGSKIQEQRKKRNLTQEKLASEMGVSVTAISKWENENSMPDIIMLCALADFFEVSTDELLGRNHAAEFMVADDAGLIRDTIAGILAGKGCKCIAKAKDGKALFQALQEHRPDGIFLDINLPDMDGLSILKEIKEQYEGVRVIMVTADDTEDTRRKAIESGADAYVTKPFLPEHIACVLKELFFI